MRILLDNVNIGSASGPNSFGRQLTTGIAAHGHDVVNLIDASTRRMQVGRIDVHLAFIEANVIVPNTPLIQRLDGIYYNSDSQYGDWWLQNKRINDTYDRATGVVFQSPFSRRLVEGFFGEKGDDDVVVVGNGVDLNAVAAIQPLQDSSLDGFDRVWACASSWRPHKRLSENVRYFLEHSGENDVLVVAGADTGPGADHERVAYVGELKWQALVALYKRASEFIHLAYHDNCPNVVVDARAAGCHITCASCAGTRWVAGSDATVIEEDDWDPGPIELYKPPQLDFRRSTLNGIESSIDIADVSKAYIDFMGRYVPER